jgi:hypothetical protein
MTRHAGRALNLTQRRRLATELGICVRPVKLRAHAPATDRPPHRVPGDAGDVRGGHRRGRPRGNRGRRGRDPACAHRRSGRRARGGPGTCSEPRPTSATCLWAKPVTWEIAVNGRADLRVWACRRIVTPATAGCFTEQRRNGGQRECREWLRPEADGSDPRLDLAAGTHGPARRAGHWSSGSGTARASTRLPCSTHGRPSLSSRHPPRQASVQRPPDHRRPRLGHRSADATAWVYAHFPPTRSSAGLTSWTPSSTDWTRRRCGRVNQRSRLPTARPAPSTPPNQPCPAAR